MFVRSAMIAPYTCSVAKNVIIGSAETAELEWTIVQHAEQVLKKNRQGEIKLLRDSCATTHPR